MRMVRVDLLDEMPVRIWSRAGTGDGGCPGQPRSGGGPKGRPMQYVNLGATGLRVSRVCLGMMSFGNDSDRPWVLDEDAAEPIVRAAVEGGITFFDTADTYSGGRQRGGHRPAAVQAADAR